MVLTLSIMTIITAFSLYDYFSSRSWQMVTSKERNETVFENRNKEYGAYKIRRDYNRHILLIFLGFVAGIGGVWAASGLFRPIQRERQVTLTTENWTADLFNKEEEQPKIPEPEVEKPAAQSLAEITEFRELIASDLPDVQPIEIVTPETLVGTQTQVGTGDIWSNPTIPTSGSGGNDTGIEIKKPDDKPVDFVDEPAKFPGGMDALRRYVAENIDINSIDGSAKVYLKFVVDTDGSISLVTVTNSSSDCKTCEKAAIKVIKSMPRWTPGKVNGQSVKSYYRMPINIQ
ncbi:energy transducer TonB [Fluviicola sp.]|jgi:protein TonB|uniref:energy transducer TonB n=1 Tax=Fluviicola sp. TaxID=1917219 RepID=UPI002830A79F|nr:energy transducer TonB [Fluviicola sp.]MDR0801328.1 energy transducer TonB [Fluviicola sp.]